MSSTVSRDVLQRRALRVSTGAALQLKLHLETLANAVSAGCDPNDERDDYGANQ